MFSLFHNLMDTFKEVEKQNKILQMNMKRKQKCERYSVKEKKAIVKETLQPFFGQDQIDIFLQHQTKRVREWSKDAIFQAEMLRRCMSRNSYRKLRESKIFPLPSLTALKTHLEKYGGMPHTPNMFSPIGSQESTGLNPDDNMKGAIDKIQPLQQSKKKERRRSIKRINNCIDESMLKLPTHIEMPVVPVTQSTTDGIMMVPVVHGVRLPSSQQEVVLAVDSIIP